MLNSPQIELYKVLSLIRAKTPPQINGKGYINPTSCSDGITKAKLETDYVFPNATLNLS